MNEQPPSARDSFDRAIADRDIVDQHLQRAWQEFAPPSNLRELVRARLTSSTAATLGAVGVGLASNARAEGTWASLQATGKLGGLVGAGLLGIGLLSGYWIREQRPELPPPALNVISPANSPPAPLEQPEIARAETAAPSSATTPLRRNAAPPRAPRAAPKVTAPASDELALLRRAERAVRSDNAALALALIGELEERHPRSSLIEERRAIELLAYCSAGATDAVARAHRFLREYPESAYAGRIRQLCSASSARSTGP